MPGRIRDSGSSPGGFTLTELLITIATIAILASLLAASLVGSKERARRTACKNQLHQFYVAIHMYSADFRDNLPGSPPGDEHTPIMAPPLRATLLSYTHTSRTMECPSLGKPFGTNWLFEGWGYVLGYNYLGGKHGTPWPSIPGQEHEWISPQSMSSPGNPLLLTEMNDWSPGFKQTFAPHGKNGPTARESDFSNPLAAGNTPPAIGAIGGNNCSLDGSVAWKKIGAMVIYHGSVNWGSEGCYAML